MKENNTSRSVTADILLAHGSRDAMWRKSFENLLQQSRINAPNKKFRLCYLELCKPNLNEVIEELTENNSKITTIIIHPIFLSTGVHFNKDIRTMVIDLQSIYPYLKFKINDVVGNNTIVSDAIIKVVSS